MLASPPAGRGSTPRLVLGDSRPRLAHDQRATTHHRTEDEQSCRQMEAHRADPLQHHEHRHPQWRRVECAPLDVSASRSGSSRRPAKEQERAAREALEARLAELERQLVRNEDDV